MHFYQPTDVFIDRQFGLSGRVSLQHNHIRNAITQTLIRLALSILRGVAAIGRGLGVFFRYALMKPLGWIGRGLFRFFFLPLYSQYSSIKRRLKLHPRLAGIRNVAHFFQRYALYLVIVSLGVFGVATNLFARTIRPDEVGQGSVWNSLVRGEASDLIVETAATKPITGVALAAVGGPALITGTDQDQAATDDAAQRTAENLGAVGVLDQSAVDTPRQTVENYTVQSGDTVGTIAEQFGLTLHSVLWANGLGESDFIKPGQVLKIPATSGYLYTVKSGDTLAGIIKKYGGTQDDILSANNLPLAEAIQPGQDIIIPGGQPPAPPVAPTVSRPTQTFFGLFASPQTAAPSAPKSSARFIWPTVSHRINQYFRGRWHTGLDIDGDIGTPIYAASSGQVTYASYDRSGYGLHVMISHGNGFVTLYGHASKVFVKVGQFVSQGQTIANQGCTGRCTGPHLHFEIRVNGTPQNPFAYY